MISPTLNVPQARFLSMPHKFKAYIAGFGSGKTWVGCGGICKGIWEHPGINQGYFVHFPVPVPVYRPIMPRQQKANATIHAGRQPYPPAGSQHRIFRVLPQSVPETLYRRLGFTGEPVDGHCPGRPQSVGTICPASRKPTQQFTPGGSLILQQDLNTVFSEL